MNDDEVEITVVPPGGMPRIYATVVSCPCEWRQDGLGFDEDNPPVPIGSVGTWYVLTKVDPACEFHGECAEGPTCTIHNLHLRQGF